jgi:hypothetical protein
MIMIGSRLDRLESEKKKDGRDTLETNASELNSGGKGKEATETAPWAEVKISTR